MAASQDRLTRSTSVTTRGSILGHNYSDLSERDAREGAASPLDPSLSLGISDIEPLTGHYYFNASGKVEVVPSPKQQSIVRIIKPHCGELTQCWLDLDIATTDSGLTLKIAVGQIGSDGISSAQSSYSQEYIDSCWRKINGNDSALAVSGGHIVAELINLLPALPSYNEAGWSQDAIALILQFNKTPQFTTTNRLKTFNITCAVEGVL